MSNELPELPNILDFAELTTDRARYWRSMDGWTVDEAAHLLWGIAPTPELLKEWAMYVLLRNPFDITRQITYEQEIKVRRNLLQRAGESGALRFPSSPTAVIAWAMGKGLRLPASLIPEGATVKGGKWIAGELSAPKSTPLQRSRAQNEAILSALRHMGYNPSALPQRTPGKTGVKATVRSKLGSGGMWTGPQVFNKAWARLRASGEIAESE